MSDNCDSYLTDMYASVRKESRDKRHNNKEFSTTMLDKAGVDYVVKNDGLHLVVFNGDEEIIDFYPTTGRWQIRGGEVSRGIRKLLKYMGVSDDSRD